MREPSRSACRRAHLQDLLNTTGDVVVLLANNARVQDARGRVERVDSWVDSLLGNATREYSGGIQVRESGGGGRVSQVIGRHVNGLNRGDGALASGGDALLESTHVSSEGRLVTDGGGDAA
eukprot:scaffold322628_cov30-Tisochrysis_lutea.AAC.2